MKKESWMVKLATKKKRKRPWTRRPEREMRGWERAKIGRGFYDKRRVGREWHAKVPFWNSRGHNREVGNVEQENGAREWRSDYATRALSWLQSRLVYRHWFLSFCNSSRCQGVCMRVCQEFWLHKAFLSRNKFLLYHPSNWHKNQGSHVNLAWTLDCFYILSISSFLLRDTITKQVYTPMTSCNYDYPTYTYQLHKIIVLKAQVSIYIYIYIYIYMLTRKFGALQV